MPEEQESSTAPDPSEAAEAPADEPDEIKRKFREVLDRKRAQHTDTGGDGGGGDPSKIHGAHGPARSQRSFRRKSGG